MELPSGLVLELQSAPLMDDLDLYSLQLSKKSVIKINPSWKEQFPLTYLKA